MYTGYSIHDSQTNLGAGEEQHVSVCYRQVLLQLYNWDSDESQMVLILLQSLHP